MSRRSTDAGRQAGLTRSSSSSSSSSTSTSSSSSSSHHIRAERSRSRSSSGGSSRSRSRTRSRERHYNKREDCAEDDRDRSDARIASRSRQQQDYQDEQQSHHEDSSSDLIDDSIRSDKSSKSSSSNGRYGDAAASQRDSVPTAAITTPKPSPKAVSARISKTAIQFGKPGTVARPGIHMKLSQGKPQPEQPKKITVASAFNNDSDDEVEEMPPECKMRMRNIGRDTPTSSGPNSFGKTKQGFIDSKKLFEKSLRQAAME